MDSFQMQKEHETPVGTLSALCVVSSPFSKLPALRQEILDKLAVEEFFFFITDANGLVVATGITSVTDALVIARHFIWKNEKDINEIERIDTFPFYNYPPKGIRPVEDVHSINATNGRVVLSNMIKVYSCSDDDDEWEDMDKLYTEARDMAEQNYSAILIPARLAEADQHVHAEAEAGPTSASDAGIKRKRESDDKDKEKSMSGSGHGIT
jgi:hypothetical protein